MLRACEFMLAPGDKSVTVAGIFHHLRTQKPAMAIFDGHNDLLLNLWLHHREDPVSAFFAGIENGHLDYPRMLQGGFAGGLFALFVPPQEYIARMTPQYASQRWDPIDILWQQLAILKQLIAHSAGRLRLCLSAADIALPRG